MPYYAANLDLREKKCLVVGGGKVAERKVKSLLQCGAKVLVLSLTMTEPLTQLGQAGQIVCAQRSCQEADLVDVFLVILATNDRVVNEKLAELALAKNLLVNTVDNQELSNFIVPATHRQGLLSISVSTSGASPALAAAIKKEIADRYGAAYAELLEVLQQERAQIKEKYETQEERQTVFNEKVKELMKQCIC